jgi:hypothetical protein
MICTGKLPRPPLRSSRQKKAHPGGTGGTEKKRFIADFVAARSSEPARRWTVIPREAPAGSPRVQDLQRRPRNLLTHACAPPTFADSPARTPRTPIVGKNGAGGFLPASGHPERASRFLGRRTHIQHAPASRGAFLGMTVSVIAATKSTKSRKRSPLFPLFPLGEQSLSFPCVKNPRSRPLAGSSRSTKDLWHPAARLRSASGHRDCNHPAFPTSPRVFWGRCEPERAEGAPARGLLQSRQAGLLDTR